jgi:DNA primase
VNEITAYSRLLDKLETTGKTVRVNGNNTAQAQCPAHDDRTPSLTITATAGSLLLHCHAGCDTDDVLSALGFTMADLFDNPRGIPYVYPDGRIVQRTPTKKFKQRGNASGTALFNPASMR